MRIALTGAGGFIGSYTARALAEAGHQVVGLVRAEEQAGHVRDALADVVVGEFQDGDAQRRLCAGAECVVHAAYDWRAMQADNTSNAAVNLLGSISLLESARLAGAGQFIFISSISAYHLILPDRKLDENHPTWPNTPYGACKAGVEPFLKACHFGYGMNTVSIRPAGVYGVDHRVPRSWYYPLVRKVLDGEPIDTAVGGKVVSVVDCADAVRRCVGNAAVAGKFFSLVDCYLYDQQVAEMARSICGSSSDIVDRLPKAGEHFGPKHHFDVSAARSLGIGLDRGPDGVEEYVEDLIEAMR